MVLGFPPGELDIPRLERVREGWKPGGVGGGMGGGTGHDASHCACDEIHSLNSKVCQIIRSLPLISFIKYGLYPYILQRRLKRTSILENIN